MRGGRKSNQIAVHSRTREGRGKDAVREGAAEGAQTLQLLLVANLLGDSHHRGQGPPSAGRCSLRAARPCLPFL